MVKLAPLTLALSLLATASAFAPTAFRPTPSQVVLSESSNEEGAAGSNEDGLKALLETKEIQDLMESKKMREAMQLVLEGKQDELQKRVQSDPEYQEIVEMLGQILGGGGGEQQ